jgi:hypothetical protein
MPHNLPLTLIPLSVGDAIKPPESLICCCTLTTVQKARDLSGGAAALRNAPLRGAARPSSHWPRVLLPLSADAGHIKVSETCTLCLVKDPCGDLYMFIGTKYVLSFPANVLHALLVRTTSTQRSARWLHTAFQPTLFSRESNRVCAQASLEICMHAEKGHY